METVKDAKAKRVKSINKKTNGDKEWCVYTDTDSITGDTIIRTQEFGKIFVRDLFNKIEQMDDTQIIERNGRTFCFPMNVRSLYITYPRYGTNWGHIDYIEQHRVRKKIYEIKMENGKSVKVTSDHSIMVLDEYDRLIEKKPTELSADDDFVLIDDDENVEIGTLMEIEEYPEEERNVYDIGMVDNPHVFFANDILVHNSVFYPAKPIVEATKEGIHTEDEEEMTDEILKVASQVQGYLNKCYDYFSRHLLGIQDPEHWFEIKQEMIARSGLWIKKKRYAQWIINDEGSPVDKLDVKGLDIVRSDFPPAFKDLLSDVIISILKGADRKSVNKKVLDFRENIREYDLNDIARPTGVKNLSKYKGNGMGQRKSGTPAHVLAALNYNDLLIHLGLENKVAPIKDGAKIKWVYVKKNRFGFEKMGFKGNDDPEEVLEFLDDFTDYPKLYEKGLKNKLESVYDAVGWKFPSINQRQAQKFFSM